MAESILGKINYLTEEQYQNAKANGQINEDEIYLTPDDKPYIETIIDEVTTNTVAVTTATTVQVGTYTIPSDGLYLVTGNVPLNHYGQEGRSLHVQLKLNGTEFFSSASVLNTAAWTVSEGVAYAQEFKKGDIITIHLGSSAATNWSCGTAKFQFTKIMKTIRSINQTGEYYSYSEQVIGTYLDKPLYRKVVDFGALPNATVKEVPHGISNIDKMVTVRGIAGFLPIPRIHKESVLNIGIEAGPVNIIILTNYNYSSTNAIAILEYTKTTD